MTAKMSNTDLEMAKFNNSNLFVSFKSAVLCFKCAQCLIDRRMDVLSGN